MGIRLLPCRRLFDFVDAYSPAKKAHATHDIYLHRDKEICATPDLIVLLCPELPDNAVLVFSVMSLYLCAVNHIHTL